MIRRYDPDDRATPGAGGKVLRRFGHYLKPYRRQNEIAIISILALTVAELLPPWLFSRAATLVTSDDATMREINILGAAAAVFDHALEEVGALLLPIDRRKRLL